MYTITKQFDFCYGHRVWSQTLNTEFSLDSCLACRHLHGHQARVIVYLQADTLVSGMVTDFKHLNWFKKWLDDVLDHKFIMDINDPLLVYEIPHLFDGHRNLKRDYLVKHAIDGGYYTLYLEKLDVLKYDSALTEKYEGMVIVNFVPTSENLSSWLFDIVNERMKRLFVKVSKVEFFETPKSRSIYTDGGV
jgi:6-pyruvoyltetrahydropterin/6-carboxytetrahydropterin synthase